MASSAVLVAFPAAALVVWALLRTPVATRLVATPSGDRWHDLETPSLGGIGIVAGLFTGVAACAAVGAFEPSSELAGVLAGCALLFLLGLADDLRSLHPAVKLAGQFAAAGIAL